MQQLRTHGIQRHFDWERDCPRLTSPLASLRIDPLSQEAERAIHQLLRLRMAWQRMNYFPTRSLARMTLRLTIGNQDILDGEVVPAIKTHPFWRYLGHLRDKIRFGLIHPIAMRLGQKLDLLVRRHVLKRHCRTHGCETTPTAWGIPRVTPSVRADLGIPLLR